MSASPAAATAREGIGTLPEFPSKTFCALPLLLGLCATACPSSGGGGADAADGSRDLQEAGPDDVRPVPPMVDFTVGDCPRLDPTLPQCRGAAPLTLSFVPLTSGNVSSFVWDFGDLTNSSEVQPVHTYVLPGSYDVGITGMPGAGREAAQGLRGGHGQPPGRRLRRRSTM